MKTAWSCLLGGVLLSAGCFTVPKADDVKKEEPPPPPAVVKPRRPAGNVTPAMVNEANAAEMARRLQQELEHDDVGDAPPVP
jgi:hypothetical protein